MFSVKYLSVIVSHCSTGTPNASLNSKVNRSGTAMIEVMGVRDGVIYLKILAELIRDNQSFLIKRHCHGWLVRCCHPVAALFLADVIIRQHVRLLGYSRVFVFVVIIESHGHNNFYTFGKKKERKWFSDSACNTWVKTKRVMEHSAWLPAQHGLGYRSHP